MKPYEQCWFYVKAYRWLKYKPSWAIVAFVCTVGWVLSGCPDDWKSPVYYAKNRWQVPIQIWRWTIFMAALDMYQEDYVKRALDRVILTLKTDDTVKVFRNLGTSIDAASNAMGHLAKTLNEHPELAELLDDEETVE